MSIDPKLAVSIDAVEVDENEFLFCICRHPEGLAIPAHAARQRSTSSPRRILLVKSAFDTPVMRQIQLPPL
jgi:hypothetical protein